MIYLKSVSYKKNSDLNGYPYNVPVIETLGTIEFNSSVTIFAGENGSGKSTLLEAVAAGAGSVVAGAEGISYDASLENARKLSRHMKFVWRVKTRKGFFLRAEDFINYVRKMWEIRSDMKDGLKDIEEDYRGKSEYAKSLARLPYMRSLYEMKKTYGCRLEECSHGEGFFNFFKARFVPHGLYILDEPETPLSPMNQFAFMAMVKEMVLQSCQFIIVTHSPIIMAYPGASIYDFSSIPVKEVSYDDLEQVKFMKSFLANPENYIHML